MPPSLFTPARGATKDGSPSVHEIKEPPGFTATPETGVAPRSGAWPHPITAVSSAAPRYSGHPRRGHETFAPDPQPQVRSAAAKLRRDGACHAPNNVRNSGDLGVSAGPPLKAALVAEAEMLSRGG